jgi:hypothetical protein
MSEPLSHHVAGAVPQPPVSAGFDPPAALRRAEDTPDAVPFEPMKAFVAGPPGAAPPRWPRVFPGL